MGDRLVSTLDHKLEPEVTVVRRLEVISGTGRRRQFTADFKARVVEATLVPGAIVSDVARRHGLTPQQVFTMAPAGAPTAGEYREQCAALRASHCGDCVATSVPARTTAQADRPGQPKLGKHRGRDRWHDDRDRPRR